MKSEYIIKKYVEEEYFAPYGYHVVFSGYAVYEKDFPARPLLICKSQELCQKEINMLNNKN